MNFWTSVLLRMFFFEMIFIGIVNCLISLQPLIARQQFSFLR